GTLHDVVVRDDVPLLVEHEARPERLLPRGGERRAEERVGALPRLSGGDDLDDPGCAPPVDRVDRERGRGDRGRGRRRGGLHARGRRVLAELTEEGASTERRDAAEESSSGERGDRCESSTGHAGGQLLCPRRYTRDGVRTGLRPVKPALRVYASASGTVVTVCSRSEP